ncbi:hypothetical protein [Pectobacterium fontis]|uniref:Uncharacterized protein n=1 Tax=Pectobacterium fontis TaxID=2558042 RepID=A0A7V8IHH2_9GAMM|nr:hypothetical protein [Pectobacterium fontis]KHN50683.1 hypothetical protein OI69_13515 [Pectobacterium fontis]
MSQSLRFFGLAAYHAASGLAALSVLVTFTLVDYYTMKPTDVSGTLLGGQMGFLLKISLLYTAISGFLWLGLFRLAGWRIVWMVAGLLQIGIALYWRIRYWHEYSDPEAMLSPDSSDLSLSMLIGIGMLTFGAWKYVKARRVQPTDRPASFPWFRTLAALFLILTYGVWPLTAYRHEPLPNCAFTPSGQQLSICLGEDDERIIVEE